MEGCKGTTLRGAVFFRMAINAVLTTITSIRTIANAATFLPAFGLPAIMAQLRCRIDACWRQVFPDSASDHFRSKIQAPLVERGAFCEMPIVESQAGPI